MTATFHNPIMEKFVKISLRYISSNVKSSLIRAIKVKVFRDAHKPMSAIHRQNQTGYCLR